MYIQVSRDQDHTIPFRCCCLGHVFGTAAASFGSVVITKRKLKTNGYALHIKQLLFAALFLFFFGFPYFFGGYCIAFWAFLFLGRKINCATGATTTAVEEEDRTQNREMHRFKGQKRVGHTARRILKKAGQELPKWQRRVKTRSSLLIRKESLKAYLEIRLYL